MTTKILPNGATEIDRKRVDTDKQIVLASWEKGDRIEFITWAIYHNDDRSTSHGHYFQNIIEATKDFQERK